VTEENRYTFSAVMSFTIEIESKLVNFYKTAAERVEQTKLKELFSTFFKRSLDRRDTLTRVRRETVIEMTLEPITGLKLKEYALQIERIIKDEEANYLEKAIKLEGINLELYDKASVRVKYTSADASEVLNRFSQESANRMNALLKERNYN